MDGDALLQGYDSLCSLALKLALNVLSTASQAMAGKVFVNRMINLTPTNNKLFFRCISLIQRFGGVSAEAARASLILAIWKSPAEAEKHKDAAISEHIRACGQLKGGVTQEQRVLPMAILLASGLSVQAAEKVLRANPIIRDVISEKMTSN